jgi:hypothetical protein
MLPFHRIADSEGTLGWGMTMASMSRMMKITEASQVRTIALRVVTALIVIYGVSCRVLYVGIDIAKRNHEASLIDAESEGETPPHGRK